jgi:TIR domain
MGAELLQSPMVESWMERRCTLPEDVASVFISYAHADKPLAFALRDGLSGSGCRVWVDEGELRIGDSLVQRISEALDRVDFVAVLVSEASVGSDWCRKEVSLAMTGEINQQGITVLPLRIDGTPMPESLKDKLYLDVERDDVALAISDLMESIRRHLSPNLPLPPRKRPPATCGPPCPQPPTESSEPNRITGIDTDHINGTRNDGTRGCGLYAVPFMLSHNPDDRWAALLVENWDHPARFTSMHRPGIARVAGDRIVLGGTTIDEVERYHLDTLKLAVTATNEQYRSLVDRERAEEQLQRRADEDQRRGVQDTVGRLDFG